VIPAEVFLPQDGKSLSLAVGRDVKFREEWTGATEREAQDADP